MAKIAVFGLFFVKVIFSEILYHSSSLFEFTKIRLDENLVQIYGRDGYITIDGTDIVEHWQQSKHQTQTECVRSGILSTLLCHNFIQFVRQWDNTTLFCGTDAAFQTCYIQASNSRTKQFSANRLVGFEPTDSTLMEIVGETVNELKIISAAPKNLNKKEFGVYLSHVELDNDDEIRLIRQTAESTFRHPTEFLVSFTDGPHVVFMARELIGRNWNGFVYHVCKNDPGLYSEPLQWLSGAGASLTCCKDNFCYSNLVTGRLVRNNKNVFLFGLFKAEYGSTTVVCVFTKRDLLDHFKHSAYKMSSGNGPSYGVKDDKNVYRTPNDCRRYSDQMHNRLSRFVTENGPLMTAELTGELLDVTPFPSSQFDVSFINDAFLLLLLGNNTIQKNTIIHRNNTFSINHNLKFPHDGANMTTEMRIVNTRLITIQNHKTIKSFKISKCGEYVTCAVCIAIGDIQCGWNSQTEQCEENDDLKLTQEIESPGMAINQICQMHVDQPIGFTRKRNEPITIATKTDNVPIFHSLTWRTPDGAVIDKNNELFFHSYQPELHRAQLVVYPSSDAPGEMDGMYLLEYKIRNAVIHMSKFSISGGNNKTETQPEVDGSTQHDAGDNSDSLTDPVQTANSSFVVMIVIVALCGFVILLFIFIMIRYNRQKRDGDENRIDMTFKPAQLRGQPSGESIHDPNYEINNRKNQLCEVTYDSAFESRQSPNQADDQKLTDNYRDCDGQSESRSEKDNSDVFISCPSQQGSVSSVDQSDQAVVLFPDGTIKRIKTKTIERLKHEMEDVTQDPESEKFIHGTLRKTKKKNDSTEKN